MPATRRSRLAHDLADANPPMTYQQALGLLDQHTAAGNPLPRTAEDLQGVLDTPQQPQDVELSDGLLATLRIGTPVTVTRSGHSQDWVIGTARDADGTFGLARPGTNETLPLIVAAGPGPIRVVENLPGLLRLEQNRQGETICFDVLVGSRRPLHTVAGAPKPPTMFAIAVGRCPQGLLSVGHFLPDGTCAHGGPPCPTCAGVGLLADGNDVVTCAAGLDLPFFAPVCRGAGRWTGQRKGRSAAA